MDTPDPHFGERESETEKEWEEIDNLGEEEPKDKETDY